ncbi:MAG: rod shape-determining protein MreC [Bacteroidota bacterium]|jgi:rod shape-determining protein MreC
MRNVFLFLKRYSVLIIFLVLQGLALSMLFSYNRFHQTTYGIFSNEVAGSLNKRVNKVESFFTLSEQNQALRKQNAALLSYLPSGSVNPDTSFLVVSDTIAVDSLKSYRQYQYFDAKIISNSVFLQQNYIVLHRGSVQGIVSNMAVVGTDGLIGTVISVSENMAIVMSLLHRQSKVIAVLKKGSGLGEVTWDGKDPRFLVLSKVPKTIVVKKGDTVVSSPYSDKFPPGIPIGYVEKIDQDQETNTYKLKIRTAVDFYAVQHAYIVKNLLQEEIDQLKSTAIKE